MAGDGVSLPTSIAQMGQVAKTQAKGQQQAQPVTPFSVQQDQKEELRVKRVKETDPTENRRVEGENDNRDKRQRRRKRRRQKILARNGAPADQENEDTTDGATETVGALVDLRA